MADLRSSIFDPRSSILDPRPSTLDPSWFSLRGLLLNTWTQNYDPLGSWPLSTLVAALPVLTLFFVLVALKKRFGVSIQAIAYRCKDIGIINQSAFGRLFKIFSERGWRTAPYEEPGRMKPELEEPKRFERLCYRALAEGVIGEARAAELLGITVRELDARLDQIAA